MITKVYTANTTESFRICKNMLKKEGYLTSSQVKEIIKSHPNRTDKPLKYSELTTLIKRGDFECRKQVIKNNNSGRKRYYIRRDGLEKALLILELISEEFTHE